MREQSRRPRRLAITMLVLAVAATVSGCLSVKSYVDPQLPKVTYSDLLTRREPRPVALDLDFQRNGTPVPAASSKVRSQVRTILERTTLFPAITEGADATADRLEIVMNNVTDTDDAARRGFVTGLTFGASGSLVTDAYVFTGTLHAAGKEPVTKEYRHALHSTIGNAEGPKGLAPLGVQEAFDRVLEDLVLNLLRDLQKDERL